MDVIIIPAYNRANYEVWGSCLCRVPCHEVLCIHACEDMRHWYGDSWKRTVRLFHQKKKKEQRSKQNKYPKNKRLEHELTVFSTKGNMHCLHFLLVYYQSASAQEWLLRKQYTTFSSIYICKQPNQSWLLIHCVILITRPTNWISFCFVIMLIPF